MKVGKLARTRMERLLRDAPRKRLTDDDRIIIFSDLHLGNGGRMDDFVHNAPIFRSVMENYYQRKGFDLYLNGDIEELHKFLVRSISRQWPKVYSIFREQQDRGGFFKIQGNHDSDKWLLGGKYPVKTHAKNGMVMDYKGDRLALFHGHQASLKSDTFDSMTHYILKYGSVALGIKNFSFSLRNSRRFQIEKRAYEFAKMNKIVAVIGHTHRPLFESLSKIDTLKFRIEQLIREYPSAEGDEKERIQRKIRKYQEDLDYLMKKDRKFGSRDSIYNQGPVVPCLFNSGCCVGTKGITGLEIEGGKIRLVYWFDADKSSKYFNYNGYSPERLEQSNFYRVSLKEEELRYIFSRIKLLA